MNGKKYFEDMKLKQNLLKKKLRVKFLEQCKLYKEQKSFTQSGFLIYFLIEMLGFFSKITTKYVLFLFISNITISNNTLQACASYTLIIYAPFLNMRLF